MKTALKERLKGRKKQIIIASLAVFLAILCIVCIIILSSLGNTLQAQLAAERFRGDNEQRFAQVSAFLPIGAGKTMNDIYTLRQTIEQKLVDASLEAEPNKTLWKDAFSSQAEVTVKGSKGSATVTAVGVGGDWFSFHPLRLRAGQYLLETDLMHDKIVVDEELAWRLFGSIEVAGMEVTIADAPFIIAGVITRDRDFASEKAAVDESGLYMHYDILNAIAGTAEEDIEISSYELVCADPITGFALGIVTDGLTGAETIQNTRRFSFERLLGIILDFGERSMNTSGIIYPAWENSARYLEDICALLLVLSVVLGLFPGLVVIYLLVRGFKAGKRKFSEKFPVWRQSTADKIRARQRVRIEKKEQEW